MFVKCNMVIPGVKHDVDLIKLKSNKIDASHPGREGNVRNTLHHK